MLVSKVVGPEDVGVNVVVSKVVGSKVIGPVTFGGVELVETALPAVVVSKVLGPSVFGFEVVELGVVGLSDVDKVGAAKNLIES